jgi:hypothetical protein
MNVTNIARGVSQHDAPFFADTKPLFDAAKVGFRISVEAVKEEWLSLGRSEKFLREVDLKKPAMTICLAGFLKRVIWKGFYSIAFASRAAVY